MTRRFHKLILSSLLLLGSLAIQPLQANAAPKAKPAVTQNALADLQKAYEDQNWELVLKLGEPLKTTHQNSNDLWKILGVANVNLNKREESLRCFLEAEKINASDVSTKRNIAYLSIWLKTEDATTRIESMLQELPDDAQLHFEAAQYFESNGKKHDAQTHFEKAAELEPQNAIFLTRLTSKFFREKKYDKAEEWTIKSIQAGLSTPMIYVNLVLACYRQGKYEDAIKWGEEGLKVKQDSLVAYHVARAELMLERYAAAEKRIRENISAPNSQFLLAQALMMQSCPSEQLKTCADKNEGECCERLQEALELFQDAENLMKDEDTRLNFATHYGIALVLAGKLSAAKSLAQTTLQYIKTPEEATLATVVAMVHWLQDPQDKKTALRFWREIKSVNPDFIVLNTVGPKLLIPAPAIAILKEIDAESNTKADQPQKTGACSCAIAASPMQASTATLSLLALLSLALLRRRKQRLS